jgi:hypothetical protein
MTMTVKAGHCRIYCLLARDDRTGVIFRRGPSKLVRLLRWHLASDTIEPGQWFRGRIRERRCDLSPDGELLVYFAARHAGPLGTWTAVSRPPYFTALALWPKGDSWGGGGLFASRRRLGLNHSAPLTLGPGFYLPGWLSVSPVGDWAGRGEDTPIERERMVRDGWQLIATSPGAEYSRRGRSLYTFATPEIYERPQPLSPRKGGKRPTLRRERHGVFVIGGPKYDEAFVVADGARELRRIHPCDWADWQANGDLLFAVDGRLYRLPAAAVPTHAGEPLDGARLIADLRPMTFEPIAAPPEALRWPR